MNTLAISTALFIAFVCCTHAQQSVHQKLFSESGEYIPRPLTQKDSKKKDSKSLPAPPFAYGKPMRLRVSVLDRNWKPVGGLGKEDFKLFVDDQETKIDSVESSSGPINFIFLIDNSVSAVMSVKDLADRTEQVTDQLAPGDRAMAIAFSEKFRTLTDLTDDRDKLKKAIRKAVANQESGTSIYDHVGKLSSSIIPTLPEPVVVVLFTDGVDTTSRTERFDTSLSAAEATNTAYYAIYLDTLSFAMSATSRTNQNLRNLPIPFGIKPTDPKQLQADYETGLNYLNDLMALSGGHTAIHTPVAGSNGQISSGLPAEIRSQYVITFTPLLGSQVSPRHQIKVRVNRPNLAVVARGSFIAQ